LMHVDDVLLLPLRIDVAMMKCMLSLCVAQVILYTRRRLSL